MAERSPAMAGRIRANQLRQFHRSFTPRDFVAVVLDGKNLSR